MPLTQLTWKTQHINYKSVNYSSPYDLAQHTRCHVTYTTSPEVNLGYISDKIIFKQVTSEIQQSFLYITVYPLPLYSCEMLTYLQYLL